jgi:iron complex transport system substrate-binding protein
MKIDRRALLGGLAAAVAVPPPLYAATITDATGRTVTSPDHVVRVYPAGPPAAVTLYTLAPDLVLGWIEPPGQKEREFLLPEIAARPALPRITGRGDTTNLDGITTFKPDLIVDIGTVNAAYSSLAERIQTQTGVPYALLDGHLDRVGATYRALGQLLGRVEAAEKLATTAEDTIAIITQRSAAVPPEKRPRVYYARDKSGLQTGLGGSMISEPIEFLGAHNVAADLHGAHGTATLDQIRAWDPEIIITSDKDFAASVPGNPDWAAIAAVKAGRVHLAPKLPFGWVDYPPAVNRLIGLSWLAKIFYPESFPQDIKTLTRDFYTLFYHVTPSAAQVERVLAGRD